MEDLWSKKVLIIRAQESVITRGIARKLEELECAVIVEAENAPNLKEEIKDTELVLMYLSSECITSPALRAQTAGICSQIEELMKQTIVVGEKEQKDTILEAFPVLKDQIWLNRPVDMELLEKEVRSVWSQTGCRRSRFLQSTRRISFFSIMRCRLRTVRWCWR